MKSLLFFPLLFCGTFLYSQGALELTLEDAVMQQWRKFRPNHTNEFQWLPKGNDYMFVSSNYQTLYVSNVSSLDTTIRLSIQDFNTATKAEAYAFFNIEWISNKEFVLPVQNKLYTYNLDLKKGSCILELPKEAENIKFHTLSGKAAYTIGNNLFVNKSAITKNKDKNIVSGQAFARSEFGITEGIFWSEKGNILAFYQKDETDVHNYPLLDINTTPGTLTSIKYPMAGQKSEKPRVGIKSLNKKKVRYISPRNGEENYLTNVSFTPDEKYLLVAEVNRAQNHMWLNLYDTKKGKFIRTIFEEQNEKWVEPEHPAFFYDDNNNFLWLSERDGYMNIYWYSLDGKLQKQLTKHAFVVKNILDYDATKKCIYYSATGENAMNTMVYRVDLNGNSEQISKSEGTHTFSLSKDKIYYYDAYSNTDTPQSEMIWTENGKMSKTLITANNPLEKYAIGTTEYGTVKGKDGSKLYYRMIKPNNFDPSKKYPVLVYVYGGPHAQMVTNSWLGGASLWMHWMANQGYIVFTLDNRGSSERGFAFESQIHRQLGSVEMEDQLSGVNFLKSLPYVDEERMAVHGWSFGGFMTTSLMLRNAGVFTTGVAGGPVTDWKYYEIMYGERYMDQPSENEKGYDQASLLNHASNLQGKLLLIHGTIDDVVVMQHNLALVKKFVDVGKQVDFFPYPMHKHNVRGKDRVHLMEKVLTYILENN